MPPAAVASGEPGDGVDDVGQGRPGLRGREALEGRQRSVSVATAQVDGRSHTFASLDGFLQLWGDTGGVGWDLAAPALLLPPFQGVGAVGRAPKPLWGVRLLCFGSQLRQSRR